MLKELMLYEKEFDALTKKKTFSPEWILSYHRMKLACFQHERLVHLLVMLFVGLFLLLSVLATFVIQAPVLLVIDVLLFVLFVPYVVYYRKLENAVQRVYRLTDTLLDR